MEKLLLLCSKPNPNSSRAAPVWFFYTYTTDTNSRVQVASFAVAALGHLTTDLTACLVVYPWCV